MHAHFSVRPRRHRYLENDLAVAVETMEEAESVQASVEGAWEEVVSVIRGCHQAMTARHTHLVTTVVFVDGSDEEGLGLKKQIPRFAAPLGCTERLVRMLPISVDS